METLFLVGQIVLGVYFVMAGIMHGMKLDGMAGYAASKGLPMPKAATAISGLMLLVGGLGVLFRWNLTLSYGLLITFLVVAAFTMHAFWKTNDPMAKMGDSINFQKNLALAAALLMLLVLQA